MPKKTVDETKRTRKAPSELLDSTKKCCCHSEKSSTIEVDRKMFEELIVSLKCIAQDLRTLISVLKPTTSPFGTPPGGWTFPGNIGMPFFGTPMSPPTVGFPPHRAPGPSLSELLGTDITLKVEYNMPNGTRFSRKITSSDVSTIRMPLTSMRIDVGLLNLLLNNNIHFLGQLASIQFKDPLTQKYVNRILNNYGLGGKLRLSSIVPEGVDPNLSFIESISDYLALPTEMPKDISEYSIGEENNVDSDETIF